MTLLLDDQAVRDSFGWARAIDALRAAYTGEVARVGALRAAGLPVAIPGRKVPQLAAGRAGTGWPAQTSCCRDLSLRTQRASPPR
jgi:hypothetical protein